MKVILTQKIAFLGNKGEVKEVAEGYARNFLIPRDLVKPFEEGLVQQIKEQREKESLKKQRKLTKEEEKVHVLQGKTFSFSARANTQGRLFAHIGPRQVVEALRALQIDISEEYVFFDKLIKSIGVFPVRYRPKKNFEAIFFLHVLPIK